MSLVMVAEADVAPRCCKDMTALFSYILYLAILAYAAQVYYPRPPSEFAINNFNTLLRTAVVKHVVWQRLYAK